MVLQGGGTFPFVQFRYNGVCEALSTSFSSGDETTLLKLMEDAEVQRTLKQLALASTSLHFALLAVRGTASLIRRQAGEVADAAFCESVAYSSDSAMDVKASPIAFFLTPGAQTSLFAGSSLYHYNSDQMQRSLPAGALFHQACALTMRFSRRLA